MSSEETWGRARTAAVRRSFYALLRFCRTALFWSAGPLELLVRQLTGRGHLPPLWLRRHAGAVGKYESSALEMAAWIRELRLLRGYDQVLDIGCGSGAMAAEFAQMLGAGGRYTGFDVHRASIRWCKTRFGDDPRFHFELAPIASPYGSRSDRPIEEYRFPMGDGQAGFILGKSIFTHLLEEGARHYLAEIRRTLCPGRAAVVTAFLFEHESRTGRGESPMFRFGDPRGSVRWRFKERPEAAVAYERTHFLRMIEEAGLRLQWLSPGFLPGDSHRPSGQDLLILGH